MTVVRIEEVAKRAGVDVVWKPFNITVMMKEFDLPKGPFVGRPQKLEYMWRGLERRVLRHGIEYKKPLKYPVDSQTTVRVGCLAATEGWCAPFSRRVFEMNFVEGRQIGEAGNLEQALIDLGNDPEKTIARVHGNDIEERLSADTRFAIDSGIFGSPSFSEVDCERFEPKAVNQAWAMDFVSDQLVNGTKFRALTIVDVFTRESLALVVGKSLRAKHVVDTLNRLCATRRAPQVVFADNGSEFSGRLMDLWAYHQKVRIDFSRPGKPTYNSFIESFNGSLRDECPNTQWFESLDEAQQVLEAWREQYNESRPHMALDGQSPDEFVRRLRDLEDLQAFETPKTNSGFGMKRRGTSLKGKPIIISGPPIWRQSRCIVTR